MCALCVVASQIDVRSVGLVCVVEKQIVASLIRSVGPAVWKLAAFSERAKSKSIVAEHESRDVRVDASVSVHVTRCCLAFVGGSALHVLSALDVIANPSSVTNPSVGGRHVVEAFRACGFDRRREACIVAGRDRRIASRIEARDVLSDKNASAIGRSSTRPEWQTDTIFIAESIVVIAESRERFWMRNTEPVLASVGDTVRVEAGTVRVRITPCISMALAITIAHVGVSFTVLIVARTTLGKVVFAASIHALLVDALLLNIISGVEYQAKRVVQIEWQHRRASSVNVRCAFGADQRNSDAASVCIADIICCEWVTIVTSSSNRASVDIAVLGSCLFGECFAVPASRIHSTIAWVSALNQIAGRLRCLDENQHRCQDSNQSKRSHVRMLLVAVDFFFLKRKKADFS